MRKKTVILISILSMTVFFTVSATYEPTERTKKNVPGAFASKKSDRSLIKDVLVGQKEIKATLQQLTRKIDSVSMCK